MHLYYKMDFLNNYLTVIQKDLLLKFYYKIPIKRLPGINKVILSFNFKTSSFSLKTLMLMVIALEILTNKKSTFIISKEFNLVLKIKKGQPIGCKIILKKKHAVFFLKTLVSNDNNSLLYNSKINQKNGTSYINSLAFSNLNLFKFNQKLLEDNYHIFRILPKLNILLISRDSVHPYELLFLLHSYKFKI